MAETLAVKEKGYTPNVLKAKVLETTKDIYKKLKISEMKVVNVGGGSGGKGSMGSALAETLATY